MKRESRQTRSGRFASELQASTNFADEVTVSAAGILATFKAIKGVTFKETLATAQDLASVFGKDLETATLPLGKALSSPTEGLAGLTRVGVRFTEQQEGADQGPAGKSAT